MTMEILVCLETSPSCEAAIGFAIAVARAVEGRLLGLAIVDEPDIRAGAAVSIGGASFKHERDDALVAEARKNAAAWTDAFMRRCEAAKVPARPQVIVGRAAASILAEMQAHNLTVLGRDANFHFETDEVDPTTRDTILHKAQGPVILVPVNGGGVGAERRPVLLAYDGSSASKRALNSFADSGLGQGREMHVAAVDDDGATAWEMTNRAVVALRERGLTAEPHNVVSVLSIPEALIDVANKINAGLLVMGAYTSSRFSTLVRGSVTHELIEKTLIPLYLHH
jgi:nucleotide-binding universal stress UspA family protein